MKKVQLTLKDGSKVEGMYFKNKHNHPAVEVRRNAWSDKKDVYPVYEKDGVLTV